VANRKEEFEDAPMYKLMLLHDDGADVGHGTTEKTLLYERVVVVVNVLDVLGSFLSSSLSLYIIILARTLPTRYYNTSDYAIVFYSGRYG
jgi:hypothetical protein